jgi:hypothetical protein
LLVLRILTVLIQKVQLHMQTFRKLRLGRCKVNHLATLVHRKLCPIPFANFALNLGSDKSGFNN